MNSVAWNKTRKLDNSWIRKSCVARSETSNEYHIDIFRPQVIFGVCFGYECPYVGERSQLYCVFLYLSLCGTGAL